MKKLTLLTAAIILTLINIASAEMTNCTWKSWFKYPANNGSYEAGKDIYTKVDPQKYQDIAYMEMYINGKFIRKESQYPL